MSDFDENDIIQEAPATGGDFDEADVIAEASASSEASELSPTEIGKTAIGGAVGYAAGKGVGAVAEKATDLANPFIEDLAYRGAGGYSGLKPAIELNDAMVNKKAGNVSQGIEALASSGAFDDGVSNRSVGREVLDKKLLGPMGLGTKEGNAVRAKTNLFKTSEPTNAILNSMEEYPIHQDSIFRRLKEIVGYDELNPTVPDQAAIKNKIDKLNDTSFNDIETPMQAERAKRDLQRGADFADPEKTVKNAINTAHATARKENVEDAIKNYHGTEKLEEFKRLKAQSGSAGIASEMLDDVYKKSQKPFSGFNSILGTGLDFVKQRGSGIAASALDTAAKGIKAGAKSVAPGVGTLLGLTVGAMAADDQTDSADFIPGLDQATAAGSALDDKLIQSEVKAHQNYQQSPAHQDRINYLQQNLQNAPESLRGGFAYKQAEQELNSLTDGSKGLNKATPDQLMGLSQSFKEIKGADKFVAPLENAAQADSEEERKARLFGLYQQPAFRQLLNKNNKS